MATYGRQALGTTGSQLQVAASDLADMDWKVGGITVDWDTVAAVSGSAVTLNDGNVIPVGSRYLRYGQVLTRITASGKYGPYDPAAGDGRQTRTPGEAYILNETVTQNQLLGLGAPATDHPAVFDGGVVWQARVLMHATTGSLANGPTVAQFQALFPRIAYAAD